MSKYSGCMPARIPQLTSEALERHAKKLGAQLRQRRKVLKLSVQNAASAAGMSRDTWYRMERGETSVTIGAWFNALGVLGLRFGVGVGIASQGDEQAVTGVVPLAISLADYPQLAALSWQLGDSVVLAPKEAHDIYERNARHIERESLTSDEKALIENLQRVFG